MSSFATPTQAKELARLQKIANCRAVLVKATAESGGGSFKTDESVFPDDDADKQAILEELTAAGWAYMLHPAQEYVQSPTRAAHYQFRPRRDQ